MIDFSQALLMASGEGVVVAAGVVVEARGEVGGEGGVNLDEEDKVEEEDDDEEEEAAGADEEEADDDEGRAEDEK